MIAEVVAVLSLSHARACGQKDIVLTGNDIANTITANSGTDTLVAGTGVATMVGGTGNDDFYVNNSADMINAQLTGTNLNTAYASVSYDMATNAQNVQDLTGVGTADLQRRMATFEAERKAYYEKQLAEYRKSLDAERARLASA